MCPVQCHSHVQKACTRWRLRDCPGLSGRQNEGTTCFANGHWGSQSTVSMEIVTIPDKSIIYATKTGRKHLHTPRSVLKFQFLSQNYFVLHTHPASRYTNTYSHKAKVQMTWNPLKPIRKETHVVNKNTMMFRIVESFTINTFFVSF